VLTYDEIKFLLSKELGDTKAEELVKTLLKADTNNSGKIDYSEFITMAQQKANILTKDNLDMTFNALDANGNGKLSVEELKEAFEAGGNRRSEKFWKDFIKEIDKDGDGEISRSEFEEGMLKLLMED
jgi:calcium-dependent protein kinase